MNVIWAILAERVVIDKDTNNLSLFNIIEEVQVPVQEPKSLAEGLGLGTIPTAFELVVLWVRSDLGIPERGFGRVRVLFPEGTDALTQEYEVDLSKFLRLRTRLRLPGLPAGGEGVYLFKIDGKPAGGKWEEMFELPLRVVLQAEVTG